MRDCDTASFLSPFYLPQIPLISQKPGGFRFSIPRISPRFAGQIPQILGGIVPISCISFLRKFLFLAFYFFGNPQKSGGIVREFRVLGASLSVVSAPRSVG